MPKIVDHDTRRRLIAAAVLRVVSREGVRGADIRSVAAEAGWSTGVIAHYFGDKKNLLVGALREALRHVAEDMADIAQTRSGLDRLRTMLEAGMPLDAERAAACRIFYHFAAEGMNDPALSAELAGYYDWWRREVGDVVEVLQAEGHFAGEDVGALSETFVGLAEGLAIQSIFSPLAETRERLRSRLAQALARFDAAPAALDIRA